MKISLADESVFIKWRRISIVGEVTALAEAEAVLTRAGVPHIQGAYYPCKSTVAKKRAAENSEPWLLVPMERYSDVCSMLFPLPEVTRRDGLTREVSNLTHRCSVLAK